jgi:hypothetical protein
VADPVVVAHRAFAVGAVMTVRGGAGDAGGQEGDSDGGGKNLLHGRSFKKTRARRTELYNETATVRFRQNCKIF